MKTDHSYTTTIKHLLETKPLIRDNDNSLIANVWAFELKKQGFDIKHSTAMDFFIEFSNGNLACAETIRRTRAKLQAENKNLRGKNYEKRQGHQKNVQKHLREIK